MLVADDETRARSLAEALRALVYPSMDPKCAYVDEAHGIITRAFREVRAEAVEECAAVAALADEPFAVEAEFTCGESDCACAISGWDEAHAHIAKKIRALATRDGGGK
jgi:hypothetical protein